MASAVILWFFLGFLAAHQFYLGRTREGLRLILLYFFAPLIVVIGAIAGMHLFGITLVPPDARPEDIIALTRDTKFLTLWPATRQRKCRFRWRPPWALLLLG